MFTVATHQSIPLTKLLPLMRPKGFDKRSRQIRIIVEIDVELVVRTEKFFIHQIRWILVDRIVQELLPIEDEAVRNDEIIFIVHENHSMAE
jgi:hypothetical protein